jgi:hypothetical protein
MVDIQLENISGITLSHDASLTEGIQHIVNIAFADNLNIVRNKKFPGTMVSSLRKSDLGNWSGFPQCHVAYTATEITSWLTPHVRAVPPKCHQRQFAPYIKEPIRVLAVPRQPKNVGYRALDTEFSGNDGLFATEEFPVVSFRVIEFAGPDGCFVCDLLGS